MVKKQHSKFIALVLEMFGGCEWRVWVGNCSLGEFSGKIYIFGMELANYINLTINLRLATSSRCTPVNRITYCQATGHAVSSPTHPSASTHHNWVIFQHTLRQYLIHIHIQTCFIIYIYISSIWNCSTSTHIISLWTPSMR